MKRTLILLAALKLLVVAIVLTIGCQYHNHCDCPKAAPCSCKCICKPGCGCSLHCDCAAGACSCEKGKTCAKDCKCNKDKKTSALPAADTKFHTVRIHDGEVLLGWIDDAGREQQRIMSIAEFDRLCEGD